jgi:hypothetical protein
MGDVFEKSLRAEYCCKLRTVFDGSLISRNRLMDGITFFIFNECYNILFQFIFRFLLIVFVSVLVIRMTIIANVFCIKSR